MRLSAQPHRSSVSVSEKWLFATTLLLYYPESKLAGTKGYSVQHPLDCYEILSAVGSGTKTAPLRGCP